MDTVEPGIEPAVITAYSERQAMDWSLVLASQDISTFIHRSDDLRWTLIVSTADYERALQSIRQYRLENRRWKWKQQIPWSDATFHWGALIVCIVLAAIYWLSTTEVPLARSTGILDSAKAMRGDWWRLFTALLLHADLGHLLANLTLGFVLFGLAMARFGGGTALLACYLAGAIGNLAGLILYCGPYHGLGASGMVLAALGLISVPPRSAWQFNRHGIRYFLRAGLAGLMLFVVIGVNPKSDLIAHSGGFLAGVFFGVILTFIPVRSMQNRWFILAAWQALGILVVLTAKLALG